MYKNLNPQVLGISGRQSEIIELALTYGFRGLEIDIQEFVKRAQIQGIERAKRFLDSGHLRISGFELPIRWRGDESVYQDELARLDQFATFGADVGAQACYVTILPATDMYPYHENFELHRKHLGEIAGRIEKHGIRLGVSFLAAPTHRAGKSFQFIHDADALVTLIKSIGSENVGLLLDTWNWHFGGGRLEQIRALGANRIIGVRMAEAPADASKESVMDEQRLLPTGSGPVDNAAVLAVLSEIGYKGPVSAVPHPSSMTGTTRDNIVHKCSVALDELLKTVGIQRGPRLTAATAE